MGGIPSPTESTEGPELCPLSLFFLQLQFSSVQLLNCVQLFVTPWTAARQASLSITNSRSLLRLISIESVMPSNHLILCHPLLLPSIFPSIRVFSNESVLCIRWPKCWNFSFSISPSNEYSGVISFRIDWFDLLAVQGKVNHQIFKERERERLKSYKSPRRLFCQETVFNGPFHILLHKICSQHFNVSIIGL